MKFAWLVLVLNGVIAAPSFAQQNSNITVHLIDVRTGKPLSHHEVLVYRVNPETHRPFVKEGLPLKGTTDNEGSVSFAASTLQSPPQTGTSENRGAPRNRLSKMLDLEIVHAGGGIQCSSDLFSLNEVLASGVVGDNRCKQRPDLAKFKPVPGEVIIFIGKYGWLEAGQT